jgi:hypothetical protein
VVRTIRDYEFSSYGGYLSFAKKWDWLHKDYILSMISSKKRGRLKAFIEFMHEEDSEEIDTLFSLKKLPSIFGPDNFITEIKETYYSKRKHYEVPESKVLSPSTEAIISAVCEYYGIPFDDLLVTRRGLTNEPRNISIYLLRQIKGEKLRQIGELFNISGYSTVSSVIRRVSRLKKGDRKVKKRINEISNKITKGQ